MKSIKRHRQINIFLLGILVAACLFFTVYDIFYEKIIWSTLYIYIPCSVIFVFGTLAWVAMNAQQLKLLCTFFLVVDFFLVIYGIILLFSDQPHWGWVTLGFGLLTLLMSRSIFLVRTQLRKSKQEGENPSL